MGYEIESTSRVEKVGFVLVPRFWRVDERIVRAMTAKADYHRKMKNQTLGAGGPHPARFSKSRSVQGGTLCL